MRMISTMAIESCSIVPEMPPKKAPMYSDSMPEFGLLEVRATCPAAAGGKVRRDPEGSRAGRGAGCVGGKRAGRERARGGGGGGGHTSNSTRRSHRPRSSSVEGSQYFSAGKARV